MRALLAQTGIEVTMTLRRGESLLLTLGLPVLLLVFFAQVDVIDLPTGELRRVDYFVPGVFALAILSTAMVGLAIATGFERQYLVLKRLGTTPLGRPRLVVAKTLSILTVEVVQITVLIAVALVMRWSPHGREVPAVLGLILLGTIAFAGLGMLLAGTLPALTVLAAANGLYVILLLVSGMVVPLDRLPGSVQAVARALPSGALAEGLRAALWAGGGIPGRVWVVLVLWAVAAPTAAALTFRWE